MCTWWLERQLPTWTNASQKLAYLPAFLHVQDFMNISGVPCPGDMRRWLWLWLCQCTSVCLWVCAQACSCKGWTSEVHVLKESEQHNSSASERTVWLSKLQTGGSQREVPFKSALFMPFPKLQIILGKLGRADPEKEMGKGLWGPPLTFLASSIISLVLSCEMLSTGTGWFHWVKKSEVGFYFLMENTAQSRGLPFWGKVFGRWPR